MKARHLPAIKLVKKPIAVPVCEACKEFRPDCEVPDGDGTIRMCWLCAHQFIDHELPLEQCMGGQCECLPEAVYPESVIAARREHVQGMVN